MYLKQGKYPKYVMNSFNPVSWIVLSTTVSKSPQHFVDENNIDYVTVYLGQEFRSNLVCILSARAAVISRLD